MTQGPTRGRRGHPPPPVGDQPSHAGSLHGLDVAIALTPGGSDPGGASDGGVSGRTVWCDSIALPGNRTAVTIGEVREPGPGDRLSAAELRDLASSLRVAVRALAAVDLPPSRTLAHLDAVVRDLAPQILVTTIYGVFDAAARSLTISNAGHLPPLVSDATAGGPGYRGVMTHVDAALGLGGHHHVDETFTIPPGTIVALMTPGVVEPGAEPGDRRGDKRGGARPADGLPWLGAQLHEVAADTRGDDGHGGHGVDRPDDLAWTARSLLRRASERYGPRGDAALLLLRSTRSGPRYAEQNLGSGTTTAWRARQFVSSVLSSWRVTERHDQVLLAVSELATNAAEYGGGGVQMRLQLAGRTLIAEIADTNARVPIRRRADWDQEHGRGLELVAAVADRWGSRTTLEGKVVWCAFDLDPATGIPGD